MAFFSLAFQCAVLKYYLNHQEDLQGPILVKVIKGISEALVHLLAVKLQVVLRRILHRSLFYPRAPRRKGHPEAEPSTTKGLELQAKAQEAESTVEEGREEILLARRWRFNRFS